MSPDLPELEDLRPLDGREVLVRVDFNVPIAERAGERVVVDDFRIRAALPTLSFLLAEGAHVTACTHLGRPKGAYDPRYELGPVRRRLEELAPGVELLENLRFDPGEEANDPAFVDRLVAGRDCYVNDAFGVAHRAHASVVGPPARLPSAAGRLLAREVEVLSGLLRAPDRPFVAVVGGAKVADKIGLLRSLARRVDVLVVGGGMAFTFFAARGDDVGASIVDAAHLDACRELLEGPTRLVLPIDVVALSPDGTLAGSAEELAALGDRAGTVRVSPPAVGDGWRGFDIGPASADAFCAEVLGGATVLWNGPMGVCEDPRFAEGTRAVAEAVAACPGFTVVGGGDSTAALARLGLDDKVGFLSTGGGAMLEYLELGDLPGLAALRSAPNARSGRGLGR